MRSIQFQSTFTEYDSADELSTGDRELMEAARRSLAGAYAPYSGFNVGAAVRLADGKIVTGNNQENAAYPSGLCAERVAVFAAAAQHPGVAIQAIAVTASAGKVTVNHPVAPCGACRQVLAEYEQRDGNIRLFLTGEKGPVLEVKSIADLLPLGFSKKDLSP